MDKLPAISIIVPVYHVENELKRCLDSLLTQTFSDYEIILINDGGNEAETAICEEYAAKNQCIVYQYQENQGLSAARNTGLSIARGNWIMFVDSDDWVNEDFCRKAFEAVEKNKAKMAIMKYGPSSLLKFSRKREPVFPEKTAMNPCCSVCTGRSGLWTKKQP